MNHPRVVSRADWVVARKELLAKEKESTRQRDALSAERRKLPMVKIEKEYVFDGPNGAINLRDLFDGRRQLVIYHFMFDPSWEEGCKSCSPLDGQYRRWHRSSRRPRHVLCGRLPRPTRQKLPAEAIKTYQPYWALAAHLLRRMARGDEAAAACSRAIGLCEDEAAREFLAREAGAD